MPRPRRGTEQVFFDTFADWPLQDQASALKVLNELHRQKRREQGTEPTVNIKQSVSPDFRDLRAIIDNGETPGGPGPEDQER